MWNKAMKTKQTNMLGEKEKKKRKLNRGRCRACTYIKG